FHGSDVREGQAITMFSPRPCWFLRILFSRPSPKATSSDTDTVPQVMPSSVSSVRTFWCRTSWSIWRRKESEVTGLASGHPLQGQGRLAVLFEHEAGHLLLRHLEDHVGAEGAHHAEAGGRDGRQQQPLAAG